MLAAVEVLDALLVLLAHIRREVTFVSLIILVHIWIRLEAFLKVDAREQWVPCHNFVQDVKVEGQLVH